MNKRKFVVIAGLCLVLVFILVILLVHHHHSASETASKQAKQTSQSSTNRGGDTTTTESTSSSDVDTAVTDAISSQVDDSSVTLGNYNIVSTSEPVSGWIVAEIQPLPADTNEAETIIFRSTSSNAPLTIILGPDTSFDSSDLDANNVPDDVRDLLVVYDD